MKTCKYIALAAMALSFAACEKENDFHGVSDPDAVKIHATIGALQTRVAYGENGVTNFEANDQIRVENTLRSSKNVATYTMGSDYKWATSDAMVWNGSSKNKFQAYYPIADYSSFESFTIPEDQTTDVKLALADWMTVETEEIDKPEDGVLNLNFQHRLVKVTVVVKEFTSQFAGTPTMSDATFHSQEVDGKIIVGDSGIKAYRSQNAEDKYTATAIVCPGKYSADSYLMTIVVIDEDETTTELNVPVNDYLVETGLQAGKHYTFSLTVGKVAVELGSVTVSDWKEQDIDGGVAKEDFSIDATEMNADEVKSAVAELLAAGHTDVYVKLAEDASASMFTAIREELVDADVADGSIDLTIAGVTAVPDNSISYPLFGMIEDQGSIDGIIEAVAELRSISLPDAETIGSDAFTMCGNLVSVSAPKVQTVGLCAFYECEALTSITLPSATSLGYQALDVVNPDSELTITLTSESEIIIHKDCFWWVDNELLDEKVNLVLHSNKQSQVNGNTYTTKDPDGNDVSFTFKSISFVD